MQPSMELPKAPEPPADDVIRDGFRGGPAFALSFMALAMMLAVISCRSQLRPATNPVAVPAQAMVSESTAAKAKINEAKPETSAKGKVALEQAEDHTDKAIAAGKQAQDAADSLYVTVSHYEDVIAERDGKIVAAQKKIAELEKRWDESWFAGRFWFWYSTVQIVSGSLLVVGLILNHYTDIFLKIGSGPIIGAAKLVWAFIAGAAKAAGQLIVYAVQGIGKLWKRTPMDQPQK